MYWEKTAGRAYVFEKKLREEGLYRPPGIGVHLGYPLATCIVHNARKYTGVIHC